MWNSCKFLNLIFVSLVLLVLTNCNFIEPSVGILAADVLTISLEEERTEILADANDIIRLDVTLGEGVIPNQDVIFSTTNGSFLNSKELTPTTITIKTSEKSGSVYLKSSRVVSDNVQLIANVSGFEQSLTLPFTRSYPENLTISSDRLSLRPDRVDFATITVNLYKDIGEVSNETVVNFETQTADTAEAEVESFVLSNDMSQASVQLKSKNGYPGNITLTAIVSSGPNSDPLSSSLDIIFEE